jgi:hypothetical protein
LTLRPGARLGAAQSAGHLLFGHRNDLISQHVGPFFLGLTVLGREIGMIADALLAPPWSTTINLTGRRQLSWPVVTGAG